MNKTKMIVVTIFCYGLVSMLPGWVFSLPTQAHQLWYVTETGDDSSDCLTTNTPCASIMEALTKPAFAPGDTILVAEGSYTNYKDFAEVHITQTVLFRYIVTSKIHPHRSYLDLNQRRKSL